MAWLEQFQYKKKIPISTRAEGSLTNYPLQVIIYSGTATEHSVTEIGGLLVLNNSSQNWPHDTRFTASNGSTELDYWIENSGSTGALSFWVELPTVDSASGTDYYLYCGSGEAETQSSGAATFTFFDDFHSIDTNIWDTTSGWGSWDPYDSVTSVNGWGIFTNTNTSLDDGVAFSKHPTYTWSSGRLLSRIKSNINPPLWEHQPRFKWVVSPNDVSEIFYRESSYKWRAGGAAGGSGYGANENISASDNDGVTPRVLEIIKQKNIQRMRVWNDYHSGSQYGNSVNFTESAGVINATGNIMYYTRSQQNPFNQEVDWVLISQYKIPEPSWDTPATGFEISSAGEPSPTVSENIFITGTGKMTFTGDTGNVYIY